MELAFEALPLTAIVAIATNGCYLFFGYGLEGKHNFFTH